MIEYHNALVENGVTDYDWFRFSQDVEMAFVEGCISIISLCNIMKPQTVLKLFSKVVGERGDDGIKMLEKIGFYNQILCLTSLYVKDKDNFLMSKQ